MLQTRHLPRLAAPIPAGPDVSTNEPVPRDRVDHDRRDPHSDRRTEPRRQSPRRPALPDRPHGRARRKGRGAGRL